MQGYMVFKVAHKQPDILGSKQQAELARKSRDRPEENLLSKHDCDPSLVVC